MRKEEWTDGQIAVLTELYPLETTVYTAELLGKSVTAINKKKGEPARIAEVHQEPLA